MKKRSFKKISKNIFGLFLASLLFLSTMMNVFAKTLTIQEVNAELQTILINELNAMGGNLSTNINAATQTLDFLAEGVTLVSFKYTDSYIEYDNRSATISQDKSDEYMIVALFTSGVMQSILDISGYSDKTLADESITELQNTFDTYGIELITEPYSSNTVEDGASVSVSGDVIKYFKMSFDTTKIDALMQKYGTALDNNGTGSGSGEVGSGTGTGEIENPVTGIESYVIPISIVMFSGIIGLLYIKNKSMFKSL